MYPKERPKSLQRFWRQGNSKGLKLGVCSQPPSPRAFLLSPIKPHRAKKLPLQKHPFSPLPLVLVSWHQRTESNPRGRKVLFTGDCVCDKTHAFTERTAAETVISEQPVARRELVSQTGCQARQKYLPTAAASKINPFFFLNLKKLKEQPSTGQTLNGTLTYQEKHLPFPNSGKIHVPFPLVPSRGLPRRSLFAFSPNIF